MTDCNQAWLARTVSRALDEDLGVQPYATGPLDGVPEQGRDVTTQAIFPADQWATAHLVARETGVVAGLDVVELALSDVSRRFGLATAIVDRRTEDGTAVAPGTLLAVLRAPVQAILIAERTILNLVCRASGVASSTRRWANALAGTGAQVLDTRKTTPGLRELDKYSVRVGGGTNKRMGLYDVAMIKDNHIAAAGGVKAAIAAVVARFPGISIQVEADTTDQAIEAIRAGARFLLLDNMPTETMANLVRRIREREDETGKVELEATGNLSLERAAEVAGTGVDYLSVGALTHSAPILDLALDFPSEH